MFFGTLSDGDLIEIAENKAISRSDDPYRIKVFGSFKSKLHAYLKEIVRVNNGADFPEITPEVIKQAISDLNHYILNSDASEMERLRSFYEFSMESGVTFSIDWTLINKYIKTTDLQGERHTFLYVMGLFYNWSSARWWRSLNLENSRELIDWHDKFYQKSIEYFTLWEELNITTKLEDIVAENKLEIEKKAFTAKGKKGAAARKENFAKARGEAKSKGIEFAEKRWRENIRISLDDMVFKVKQEFNQFPEKYGLYNYNKNIPTTTIRDWLRPVNKSIKNK